jgi:hypothetical protein
MLQFLVALPQVLAVGGVYGDGAALPGSTDLTDATRRGNGLTTTFFDEYDSQVRTDHTLGRKGVPALHRASGGAARLHDGKREYAWLASDLRKSQSVASGFEVR